MSERERKRNRNRESICLSVCVSEGQMSWLALSVGGFSDTLRQVNDFTCCLIPIYTYRLRRGDRGSSESFCFVRSKCSLTHGTSSR